MKNRYTVPVLMLLLMSFFAPAAYAAFPANASTETSATVAMPAPVHVKQLKKSQRTPDQFRRAQQRDGAIGFGIASIACAFVGLFVLAIPLGIAAIVFGIIGMNKPLQGLAIAGIILGAIDVIAGLIYISTL